MKTTEIVHVSPGAIGPAEQATVPATDEGLLRGDGIFEVMRLYGGRPFGLDDHLTRMPFSPRALGGRPFYFLRGHLAAVPVGLAAPDLAALRRGIAEVDESSIYYHAVEAIGLGNPRGDFAAWIEDVLQRPQLARRVRELDPFVMSLGHIQQQLLALLDQELGGPA